MSAVSHEETLGLFDAGSNSDEPDAHPAHTEHYYGRDNSGDDCAADHESVCERIAHAMRHHDRARAGREMRKDEERAEPIMRYEADVPRVLDKAAGPARRDDESKRRHTVGDAQRRRNGAQRGLS